MPMNKRKLSKPKLSLNRQTLRAITGGKLIDDSDTLTRSCPEDDLCGGDTFRQPLCSIGCGPSVYIVCKRL